MRMNLRTVNAYYREKKKFPKLDTAGSRTGQYKKYLKKYSSFNPSLKVVRNRKESILWEPKKNIQRWREYFADLLNGEIPSNFIE